jgi:hypothetical protein
MALPILDGNQTSVTLATTVSGGAHYPNHIIASSVTISSLPAISGTVTAQLNYVAGSAVGLDGGANDIVGLRLGYNSNVLGEFVIVTESSGLPISGTVAIGSALPAGTNRIGVVTIGAGTVTLGAGTAQIGTVTPSLQYSTTTGQMSQDGLTKILQQDLQGGLYQNDVRPYGVPIAFVDTSSQGTPSFRVAGNNGYGLPVTVTAGYSRIGVVTIGGGTVTIGAGTAQIGSVTASITGTIPISISSVTIGNTVTVAGTVTANLVSTTVTISALPSGALTTRFGSVTTANTAQITTAVTNTSRKYLLAQNISAGTVTIGVGFSPTTTQGIQLTAGAGLTFDSFVPTGAVYWLGATTGAAYSILEG